jgi:flavin reductase (DIM6/NTAB) family NADH-FMN oxidoreductase RutF
MGATLSILPSEISTSKLHGYLLGAVGPRPIAFASTLDEKGNPNLSPFSFFNVFSANPPLLIFSPARRVRDNTTKHTLKNVLKTKEVVINIVTYGMVQQVSLASTEYPDGVNEFKKAGFTMLKSDLVQPFRVKESPVQFECKVTKVEALREEGGAGNLVFAEVLKMHIKEEILDETGTIDQYKIDQVARMGGSWYTRAQKGLFEVPKPLSTLGIGVDQIPVSIRYSKVLSGNDLGMLGNIEMIPAREEVEEFLHENVEIRSIISADDEELKHKRAKEYLINNDVLSAWKVLLANT